MLNKIVLIFSRFESQLFAFGQIIVLLLVLKIVRDEKLFLCLIRQRTLKTNEE